MTYVSPSGAASSSGAPTLASARRLDRCRAFRRSRRSSANKRASSAAANPPASSYCDSINPPSAASSNPPPDPLGVSSSSPRVVRNQPAPSLALARDTNPCSPPIALAHAPAPSAATATRAIVRRHDAAEGVAASRRSSVVDASLVAVSPAGSRWGKSDARSLDVARMAFATRAPRSRARRWTRLDFGVDIRGGMTKDKQFNACVIMSNILGLGTTMTLSARARRRRRSPTFCRPARRGRSRGVDS